MGCDGGLMNLDALEQTCLSPSLLLVSPKRVFPLRAARSAGLLLAAAALSSVVEAKEFKKRAEKVLCVLA
jgi:hypothetical protein